VNRFKNILVATDARYKDQPILAAAAEIAVKNQSTLKIVDVVPEFPPSVRRSLPDHEHLLHLMRKEKREKLEALAANVRNQIPSVSTKVLHGKTSVEIIREVLRERHD
jgi:nucleotide-binding universal stress UspA family protein